jgi:hypothetical protein
MPGGHQVILRSYVGKEMLGNHLCALILGVEMHGGYQVFLRSNDSL